MRFSFFIAVFIAFSPNLSKAIDVQNSSSVTIMQDLSLTQQTELNFGKVLIPASGTHLVRVKNNGDYHETTTGTIGNSQTHGRFYGLSGQFCLYRANQGADDTPKSHILNNPL